MRSRVGTASRAAFQLLLALWSCFATGCSDDVAPRAYDVADAAPSRPDGSPAGPAVPGSTSPNPTAKCSAHFGNLLVNQSRSASADGDGNFLVLIDVQGSVDVGSATIEGPAIAVVKLDSNCVPLGFRTIAAGDELGFGPRLMAADHRGNSYVALPNMTNERFGVFQVTPDGQLGWSRMFQSSVNTFANALTLGADGSIFLSGTFLQQLDVGNHILVATSAVFVVKLDTNGNTIWSRAARVVDPGSDENPLGMALDPAGNPVLWGSFFGSADFGGGKFVRPENDGMQGYLAKLDGASGEHIMSRAFRNLFTGRMVADAQGHVWMSGRTLGLDIDFGCGPLWGSDPQPFLAKMTADGQRCLWSRAFPPSMEILQLAVDRSGNLLFAGGLNGKVDLGAGMIGSSNTGIDFLLASFDSEGHYRFARTWAGGSTQIARSAVVDPNGGIGLFGEFENAIDFGAGPIKTKPPPGGPNPTVPRDVFFVRY